MNSEILINQNPYRNIKIDVLLEDETVWLSQAQILVGEDKRTISEHIGNMGELDEKVVVRNFRTTTQHGAIVRKTQERDVKGSNLDVIIYRRRKIHGN